jgi:predicted MFS family arabinose efflux permease
VEPVAICGAAKFHVEHCCTWCSAPTPPCDNRALSTAVISLARYTALLAARDVRRSIAASIVGRLPIGLSGLAILLLVQIATGSFAQGGAATAAYVFGLAAMAPALGRLIDRYGPRLTLIACGTIYPALLATLVISVQAAANAGVVLALCALAGAAFPPISVCMRAYLRQRLGDDPLLSAAYSLESVLIELIFIAGPMLVALFVAAASPGAAVLFSAACALAGTALFLRSPALADWRIAPRTATSLLGPLAERGFPALIGVILCYSAAFGLVEIGLAAYATERGRPALAGVLLGLMSIGSAMGGLTYGSRSWHYPLTRQFSLMLALMAVGLAVLAVPWHLGAFAAWTVFAGIVMAPALIIQSMLVARAARAEHLTEAFTWSTSALLAGVGLGMAAGGGLLEYWSSPIAFATGAGAALAAAAGASLLHSDWRPKD